jgi:hypothetical protein
MRNKIIMIAITALIVVSSMLMVAWFAYDAGYTVGSIEAKNEKYKTITGVYIAEDREYGSLALVINEDGTCNHPFGISGTWTQEGDTITFVFASFTQEAIFDSQTHTIYYENRRYYKIY